MNGVSGEKRENRFKDHLHRSASGARLIFIKMPLTSEKNWPMCAAVLGANEHRIDNEVFLLTEISAMPMQYTGKAIMENRQFDGARIEFTPPFYLFSRGYCRHPEQAA